MDLTWFDAEKTDPLGAKQTAIPAGDYQVVIVASQEKETKSGTGSYLSLTLEVINGEHVGATVWAMVNLRNPSQQAVQMGRRELSSICRAVGKLAPADSTDLHDIPLIVTVALDGARNKVTGWAPVPTPPAPPSARGQGTTTTPPTRPPWARA